MEKMDLKKTIENCSVSKFHIAMFACCLVTMSFDGYDLVVYGTTLPLMMKSWELDPATAGFIASFGFGAGIIGAVVGGYLGDRWGRRRTIILSAIVFSLGSLSCATASGPSVFAWGRIITGLGLGMTLNNEVALISEYFPLRFRRLAVSSVTTGMQIGGIMSAVVALTLLQAYGWRAPYYFGALPILLVPVLLIYLPEVPWMLMRKGKFEELRRVLRKVLPDISIPESAQFEYQKADTRASFAEVFAENRTQATILFWIIYFMNVYVIFGTNTWVPKFMLDQGFALGASLWLYLALYLGGLIASPLLGRLADRYGCKNVLRFNYVVAVISILVLSAPIDAVSKFVVMMLAGACTMGSQNLTHAYVSLYFPPTVKSTFMGWGMAVGRTGGFLGPAVAGLLLVADFPLFTCFLSFAVPCALAGVAVSLIPDRYSYSTQSGSRQITTEGPENAGDAKAGKPKGFAPAN